MPEKIPFCGVVLIRTNIKHDLGLHEYSVGDRYVVYLFLQRKMAMVSIFGNL